MAVADSSGSPRGSSGVAEGSVGRDVGKDSCCGAESSATGLGVGEESRVVGGVWYYISETVISFFTSKL